MAVIQIDTPRTTTALPNPFNVLGTDVSSADSVADVLTTANLRGWNVRTREMVTVAESISPSGVTVHPSQLRVPNNFAVIRDNPVGGFEEIIGVVGSDWTARQNEQIEETMESLVGESGGKITAAGDFYGNGKQVFFTIELPVSAQVVGVHRSRRFDVHHVRDLHHPPDVREHAVHRAGQRPDLHQDPAHQELRSAVRAGAQCAAAGLGGCEED
jgi:hypothetical protein